MTPAPRCCVRGSAYLHLVRSGSAAVCLAGPPPVRLHTLGPGDSFGEQAGLTGEPMGATVEALEPLTTLAIRQGLLELVDHSPDMRHHLLDALVQRVSHAQ